MTSIEQIALELYTGGRLILQRLPIEMMREDIHSSLSKFCHLPVNEITDIFADTPAHHIRYLYARGWLPEQFQHWDARRASLCSPDRPVVVILDVMAATSMLCAAPQCCAWAGGVRLPLEPIIKLARSEAEIRIGERIYQDLVSDQRYPIPPGVRVGIEISTRRVFRRRPDAPPEHLAAEALDSGLLYLRTWGDP